MSRVMRTAVTMDYPYSDGQPMAESELQLVPMLYLLTVLRSHFRTRADVYVGGDMFLYYEEGNPAAVVAPDVFVVIGAPKRSGNPRKSYKLWEEPKGPDLVLEVLSESTRGTDRGEKRVLYASLGVREYWLLDPTAGRNDPRLQGMRLLGGVYRDLPAMAADRGGRALHSAVLGLDVRVDRSGAVRLRDPVTGEDLLSYDEEHDARRAAEIRARQETTARKAEAAARQAVEARVTELEALVRELRGESAPFGDGA